MNCEDCYGRGWRWQGTPDDNAERTICDNCAGTGRYQIKWNTLRILPRDVVIEVWDENEV